MIENTQVFASKIKLKNDSFSMANSKFIDKNTVESKLMNIEDAAEILAQDFDAEFSIFDHESNTTKNYNSKIVKVDKETGLVLLNISGNA
jgi:hypothetical protein